MIKERSDNEKIFTFAFAVYGVALALDCNLRVVTGAFVAAAGTPRAGVAFWWDRRDGK